MNDIQRLSNEGDALIEAFIVAFNDTAKSLMELGKLLVRIADTVPHGMERLLERLPRLAPSTIHGLLKIGRGQVDERLFLGEGPGITKLRQCDIATQRKYAEEPIPVLITESGQTTHLLVSVWDMAGPQTEQVFGHGFIRTLEQQRQWLATRRPKPQNIALKRPYTVLRGKVRFHQECELTVQQLSLLLAEAAS